jgi:hypothetical protein
VVTIFTDKKPFTVAESFYVDAKFYIMSVDKISKPKSRCLLNQIPQRKIAEKLHLVKRYINMSQVINEKETNQYFVSYTNHPKMKVLISPHLYHLWYNKK